MVFLRSAFALGLLATLCGSTAAGVQYMTDDTFVDRADQASWHPIRVLGDVNGYSVISAPYDDEEGHESTLQCGMAVKGSARMGRDDQPLLTGPCQTTTKDHRQVVIIECIDPQDPTKHLDGKAMVTFHHLDFNDLGRVKVETQGFKIWFGFTNESKRAKLHKSSKTSAAGSHTGVVVSCYSNSRSSS